MVTAGPAWTGRLRPRRPIAAARVIGAMLFTAWASATPSRGTAHVPTGGPGPPDSAAVEKELRRAQASFERDRRRRLPATTASYGRCPERIGRFCHWYEDPRTTPRAEPASVAILRRGLIARLDTGYRRLPGSRWIAGQLVHYLIEDGHPDSALAAVGECRAAAGWCAGFAGLALHALGRDADAEAAFSRWEAALDPEERCAEHDLSWLLEGAVRSHYERLPCPGPARQVFERRFWWLADPLYLTAGNERRAEDRARRLTSLLAADAATPYGIRWGPDLDQLTLRYAWPSWWERIPRDPLRPGDVDSRVAHDPPHGLAFAPRIDPLTPPGEIARDGWRLEERRPRSTYAPAYADTFLRLPGRFAAFRRPADSVVLVAAYALPEVAAPGAARGGPDRGPGRDRLAALLLLSGGPDDDYGHERLEPATPEGVLSARAPARGLVASLEVLGRPARVAARLRLGMDLRASPSGVPAISGLLVGPPRAGAGVDTAGPTSGLLPEAPADPLGAARALRLAGQGPWAAPAARPGQTLRLYWEMYGLPPRQAPLRVEVTLREAEPDWFEPGRPEAGDGPGGKPRVRLAWSEVRGAPRRAYARRVALALPRSLREGLFAVEVRVLVPGWTPLTARAPVRVRAPGGR
jgi:hypothetical protein